MTLQQALEIVNGLTFDKVPANWKLDRQLMAKAYRSYRRHTTHEIAVDFLGFYLHQFRIRDFVILNA
jgi:hypothetical protein